MRRKAIGESVTSEPQMRAQKPVFKARVFFARLGQMGFFAQVLILA
jgi:hypothetical protein